MKLVRNLVLVTLLAATWAGFSMKKNLVWTDDEGNEQTSCEAVYHRQGYDREGNYQDSGSGIPSECEWFKKIGLQRCKNGYDLGRGNYPLLKHACRAGVDDNKGWKKEKQTEYFCGNRVHKLFCYMEDGPDACRARVLGQAVSSLKRILCPARSGKHAALRLANCDGGNPYYPYDSDRTGEGSDKIRENNRYLYFRSTTLQKIMNDAAEQIEKGVLGAENMVTQCAAEQAKLPKGCEGQLSFGPQNSPLGVQVPNDQLAADLQKAEDATWAAIRKQRATSTNHNKPAQREKITGGKCMYAAHLYKGVEKDDCWRQRTDETVITLAEGGRGHHTKWYDPPRWIPAYSQITAPPKLRQAGVTDQNGNLVSDADLLATKWQCEKNGLGVFTVSQPTWLQKGPQANTITEKRWSCEKKNESKTLDAGAATQKTTQSPDHTVLIVGIALAAVLALAVVVWIGRQPSEMKIPEEVQVEIEIQAEQRV